MSTMGDSSYYGHYKAIVIWTGSLCVRLFTRFFALYSIYPSYALGNATFPEFGMCSFGPASPDPEIYDFLALDME